MNPEQTEIVGPPMFTCLRDARNAVGESPVWDERRETLLWCDSPHGLVFELATTGACRQWRFRSAVGSLGLCESGRVIVALADRVILFDRASARHVLLCRVPVGPGARLNDGKVGPDGAFWVGSMDLEMKAPRGGLFRIAPSGQSAAIRSALIISNGLAWSPDGRTMYHSDSRGGWVDSCAFDAATGGTGAWERFADLDEAAGRPDGAATDSRGDYWSCGVSAGVVNRFSAGGVLVATYRVPVPAPTMLCFGGAKLDRLFLTSLRSGRGEDILERYPLSGGLFTTSAGIAGTPVARFRDETGWSGAGRS